MKTNERTIGNMLLAVNSNINMMSVVSIVCKGTENVLKKFLDFY